MSVYETLFLHIVETRDFEIQIHEHKFLVNKTILIATSGYFRSYFSFPEYQGLNVIQLTRDPVLMVYIIDYFNTGKLSDDLASELYIQIYMEASFFAIKDLQVQCMNNLNTMTGFKFYHTLDTVSFGNIFQQWMALKNLERNLVYEVIKPLERVFKDIANPSLLWLTKGNDMMFLSIYQFRIPVIHDKESDWRVIIGCEHFFIDNKEAYESKTLDPLRIQEFLLKNEMFKLCSHSHLLNQFSSLAFMDRNVLKQIIRDKLEEEMQALG